MLLSFNNKKPPVCKSQKYVLFLWSLNTGLTVFFYFSDTSDQSDLNLWNMVRVINILIMVRLLRIIWHIKVKHFANASLPGASSVGSVSTLAIRTSTLPSCTFFRGKNFPHPLIQEEQVVSYWPKNGHLIMVSCLWEACLGTV